MKRRQGRLPQARPLGASKTLASAGVKAKSYNGSQSPGKSGTLPVDLGVWSQATPPHVRLWASDVCSIT